VEENWMHLSKDTAFAFQAWMRRESARKVESGPRGRG
jgi:hypothetical protein